MPRFTRASQLELQTNDNGFQFMGDISRDGFT